MKIVVLDGGHSFALCQWSSGVSPPGSKIAALLNTGLRSCRDTRCKVTGLDCQTRPLRLADVSGYAWRLSRLHSADRFRAGDPRHTARRRQYLRPARHGEFDLMNQQLLNEAQQMMIMRLLMAAILWVASP